MISRNLVVSWVRPVMVEYIEGYPVYFFGFFMCAAFLVCYVVADKEFQRLRLRVDPAIFLLVATAGGLCGAKVHFLLQHFHDPTMFGRAGLIWQGGAVGGALAIMLVARVWYPRQSLWRLLDAAAPLVPLGHAIGKVGCFTSGDGCYGPRSNVAWAMAFPNGKRPTHDPVHPTPLYESFLDILVFLHLWNRRGSALFCRCEQTATMVLLHCGTRFVTEFWRDHDHDGDPMQRGELSSAQMCSLVGVVFGAGVRIYMRLQPPGLVLGTAQPLIQAPNTAAQVLNNSTAVETKKKKLK